MISPVEENSCRAFGIESVEELKDKVDEDGQYGWTAWRNYGCCIPGPGTKELFASSVKLFCHSVKVFFASFNAESMLSKK
jgi:hypothetical protein